MVRKRLDDRVRHLLDRAQQTNQRSMLMLVGDYGKDQVPSLHRLLGHNTTTNPAVLWCYKKDLGFSTHQQKRMKKLKQMKARGLLLNETEQAFDLFISQAPITWCYYKDSHRVLGTTVQMLVLQDFEALTPNLLARTMETVAGGGLVVVLLKSVQSLQQLYHMTMDVHARYRGASTTQQDVVARFNERFLLSLADNASCLVCDDELNVLPLSRKALKSLNANQERNRPSPDASDARNPELQELQESLQDTPHVGVLVGQTKTVDQARAVLQLLDSCAEKQSQMKQKHVVTMTAARGRGKSAALGLALAGALGLGYSTICVTAPTPENLVAVFEFCKKGLIELRFQEHLDFTVTYNNAEGRDQTKCILSIQINKTHRQLVQYVAPGAVDQFQSAEIVAIDEAAAIPLPMVRALIRKHGNLVWITSTVNGYEGTGRALSLKLIQELRQQQATSKSSRIQSAADALVGPSKDKRTNKIHEQRWAAAAQEADKNSTPSLVELELQTPIRYAENDPIEKWLNQLLCLESPVPTLTNGAPSPDRCELYSVDRDALFSYHRLSEAFLQKIMGLYTSAHYKNTPNDLQLLSDAPAHSLFVLLSPHAEEEDGNSLPDVLAVIQVSMEGQISRKAVEAQLSRGHRSAGDLIPWTLSQQFGDSKFAQLSGARIVRIATHPSVQGMGYGSHAMQILYRYYNGELISLVDDVEQEKEEVASDGGEAEEDDENESSDGEKHEDSKTTRLQREQLKPRKKLPPLLLPLTEVRAPKLDWLGTSFGLTLPLLKFWSNRCGMRLLYLRQTQNELTGEHSSIMVRSLSQSTGYKDSWLDAFASDTRRRLISLLGFSFRHFDIKLALATLESLKVTTTQNVKERAGTIGGKIGVQELELLLTPHDLKRLELYGRNLVDHHLVTDLLPTLAQVYFTERLGSDFSLSSVQAALLCGVGLQAKSLEQISEELNLPLNQLLAMFNKSVRKMSICLNSINMEEEKKALQSERSQAAEKAGRLQDVSRKTLEEDLSDGAEEAMDTLNKSNILPPEISQDPELMQYAIKGSSKQWDKALGGQELDGSTIQIQSTREKRGLDEGDIEKTVDKDKYSKSSKTRKKNDSKTKKTKKVRR